MQTGGLFVFDARAAWDSATSDVRYSPDTGHIWVVSIAQGFQILEPTGGNCRDEQRPRVRLDRARLRVTATGARVAGRASDRGCAFATPAHRGGITRSQVAIGRGRGRGRCRYLNRNGTLGAVRRCARPHYMTTTGTTRFALRLKARLPSGRWRIHARAIDPAGNCGTGRVVYRRLR